MMRRSTRAIIQMAFLEVLTIAGIFNVSYGQAKADKLDKLISTKIKSETKDVSTFPESDEGKFHTCATQAVAGK